MPKHRKVRFCFCEGSHDCERPPVVTLPESRGRVEHYFVTRTHCKNCDGAGYFSNPITAERRDCVDCDGVGYWESREMLTDAEARACKAAIDWNAERLRGRR